MSLASLAFNPAALSSAALAKHLNSQLPASPKAAAANKGLAQATFSGLGVTFTSQDKDTTKFGLSAEPAATQRPQNEQNDLYDIMRGLSFLQGEMARVLQVQNGQQFAGRQVNLPQPRQTEAAMARDNGGQKPLMLQA